MIGRYIEILIDQTLVQKLDSYVRMILATTARTKKKRRRVVV